MNTILQTFHTPMRSNVLFLFCLIACSLSAQINIGSSQMPIGSDPGKWRPGQLEALRRSTTLVFLRPSEASQVEAVQAKLNQIWTISKIEVHTSDRRKEAVDAHPGEALSFLELHSNVIGVDHVPYYYYAYIQLQMDGGTDKKGRSIVDTYARVELHPSAHTLNEGIIHYNDGLDLYAQAQLDNFTPGLLVNYAKYINDQLEKGASRNLYSTFKNEGAMGALRNSTLYVTDNVALEFGWVKKTEAPVADPKALFAKYPYRYELISSADLDHKLMTETEPFYYMVYVRSSLEKYIAIYKSDTGEMIYADYDAKRLGSQNLEPNDMAKIAALIRD
jgi:hypothetical protein